jgi:hypothetical protein
MKRNQVVKNNRMSPRVILILLLTVGGGVLSAEEPKPDIPL